MTEDRFSEPDIDPQELKDADDPELDGETTKTEVIKRAQLVRLKLIKYFEGLGIFEKIGNKLEQITEAVKAFQDKKWINEQVELRTRQIKVLTQSLNRKATRIAKLRIKREREKKKDKEEVKN
jgi:predicted RNase H-like nuclease (RuvC/YqgF family)